MDDKGNIKQPDGTGNTTTTPTQPDGSGSSGTGSNPELEA